MSKKWFLPLAVLLCCTVLGGSLAFKAASITAYNVITVGNVKLKLHETLLDKNGIEQAVDMGESINITSAAHQERRFYVENTGKNPLYARVRFLVKGTRSDGGAFTTSDYLEIQAEQRNWIKENDWYYYSLPVEPGQRTDALETEICFLVDELTRKYPGSWFQLFVQAQAVQSQNNETDVLKIQGWPKEDAI